AAAVALGFMIVDRYVQLPIPARLTGPWLAGIALAVGIIGAIVALLRRHDPFRVAVKLDIAFPQHRDRWASSLDLAERIDAGDDAGHRASLDRLFADTEILPASDARSIVPRRRLWIALTGLVIVAMAV